MTIASVGDPLLQREAEESAERSRSRVLAMDAIRGFALLGILLRNTYAFGIPALAYSFPLVWSGEALAEQFSWAFVEVFVDGAMRALFSILFGAGALMLLSRMESLGVQAVDYFYRRLIWLMLFGLIHAYLMLCSFDILFVYGALGLLIFPLRNLKPRTLLLFGLSGLLLSSAQQAIEPQFIFQQIDNVETGHVNTLRATPVAWTIQVGTGVSAIEEQGETDDPQAFGRLGESWIAEVIERREGYWVNLITLAETSLENHSIDIFRTHILDIGTMFLIGMALFKLGVVTGERTTRFYLIMLLTGYGIGLSVNFAEVYPELTVFGENLEPPAFTVASYDAGRLGTALGHLALVVLLSRLRFALPLIGLFAAAGRMSLTNYLLQTAILTTVFFGFGLGLYGAFDHSALLLIAVVIGALQLTASRLYLAFFRQGPMEWLMRRLVSGRMIRQRSDTQPT